MKRRFIAFLLMIVMIVGVIPFTVNAADGVNLIDELPPYAISSNRYYVYTYPSTGSDSIKMGGQSYKNSLQISSSDFNDKDDFASFNLGGNYESLTGIIGPCDSTNSGGKNRATVNFYVDGNVAKTIEVQPTGLPQDFSLNVSGVRDLKIEVKRTSSTESIWVGFAELKLYGDGSTSGNINQNNNEQNNNQALGNRVPLIDVLPPYAISSNRYYVYTYPSTGSDSIKMGGRSYKNSLQISSSDFNDKDDFASFNLGGNYESLTGIIGPCDSTNSGGKNRATVNFYVDGNVAKTIEVQPTGLPQDFSLNVSGVRDLKIEVKRTSSTESIWVGFAELYLSASGSITPTPTPTPVPTPTPTPTQAPTPTPTPAPTPSTGVNPGGFDLEAITVGVKLRWNPLSGGLGYRLYRSENSGAQGISVTDFYITTNQFVDVNVTANTTYYYTIRQVLAEARPFEGVPEKLGPPSSQIKVTTGSNIPGGGGSGSTKKFILMKLNDPMMNADGILEEIDPGRGTTPIIFSSRTLVPIRAIVEKMGGTVIWDDRTKKISLQNAGKNVVMWLENNTIAVNGSTTQIDVAPKSINGRTMVPIRFAAENLGCQVDWINSTQEIVIVYYANGSSL